MCPFSFLVGFLHFTQPKVGFHALLRCKDKINFVHGAKKVYFFHFFSFPCFSAKALSKSMRKLRVLSKVSRRMMRSS